MVWRLVRTIDICREYIQVWRWQSQNNRHNFVYVVDMVWIRSRISFNNWQFTCWNTQSTPYQKDYIGAKASIVTPPKPPKNGYHYSTKDPKRKQRLALSYRTLYLFIYSFLGYYSSILICFLLTFFYTLSISITTNSAHSITRIIKYEISILFLGSSWISILFLGSSCNRFNVHHQWVLCNSATINRYLNAMHLQATFCRKVWRKVLPFIEQ
jgi:hypothetical protein